jgi:hypothetical protein
MHVSPEPQVKDISILVLSVLESCQAHRNNEQCLEETDERQHRHHDIRYSYIRSLT